MQLFGCEVKDVILTTIFHVQCERCVALCTAMGSADMHHADVPRGLARTRLLTIAVKNSLGGLLGSIMVACMVGQRVHTALQCRVIDRARSDRKLWFRLSNIHMECPNNS